MALMHHEGQSVPPDQEKTNLEMPGSGAPTQETAEQQNVPELDTSIQSTTVVDAVQAPEVAPFPPVPTQETKSRRGIIIGSTVAALGLAAGAFLGLSGSSDSDRREQPVAATDTTPQNQEDSETTPVTAEGGIVINEGQDSPEATETPLTYQQTIDQYMYYPDFLVEPVMSDDPRVYINELNRLLGIYLLDERQDKADRALATLTGDDATPFKLRDGLEQMREDNFAVRSSGRNTYFSDPESIRVVRSGPNYAVIETINTALHARVSHGVRTAGEIPNSTGTAYYYIRIMPNGQKYAFGIDDADYGWQGGSTLDD